MSIGTLLLQRRFWIAVAPAAIIVANAMGVPITAELLQGTADKVLTGAMAVASLFSLFVPNKNPLVQ